MPNTTSTPSPFRSPPRRCSTPVDSICTCCQAAGCCCSTSTIGFAGDWARCTPWSWAVWGDRQGQDESGPDRVRVGALGPTGSEGDVSVASGPSESGPVPAGRARAGQRIQIHPEAAMAIPAHGPTVSGVSAGSASAPDRTSVGRSGTVRVASPVLVGIRGAGANLSWGTPAAARSRVRPKHHAPHRGGGRYVPSPAEEANRGCKTR